MRDVVFVAFARTAFGRMGGSLRQYHAAELGGIAIKGLLNKTGVLKRGHVDSVFMGSALMDAQCNNIARYAALLAGLPYETSACFMEMQCGSAIACINQAAINIKAGVSDVIIAGGCESYSQQFARFPMSAAPYTLTAPAALPSRLAPDDEQNLPMIGVANLLAQKFGISRDECDEFALRSQTLAAKAIDAGCFEDEIVPVSIPAAKNAPARVFSRDEHPRRGSTLEGLRSLKAAQPDGVVTAGNASGRNDGAACVLMMSADKAREYGYTPLGRWVMGADVGVEPRYMGMGPAYSNLKILSRLGLGLNDVDVYECNEAFAAQNLAVIKEMEALTGDAVDMGGWNPCGGAIAFGHPNGASGARIAMAALGELARRGGRYAMISSCCGGGLGVSALLEKC